MVGTGEGPSTLPTQSNITYTDNGATQTHQVNSQTALTSVW